VRPRVRRDVGGAATDLDEFLSTVRRTAAGQ